MLDFRPNYENEAGGGGGGAEKPRTCGPLENHFCSETRRTRGTGVALPHEKQLLCC